MNIQRSGQSCLSWAAEVDIHLVAFPGEGHTHLVVVAVGPVPQAAASLCRAEVDSQVVVGEADWDSSRVVGEVAGWGPIRADDRREVVSMP